MGLVASYTAVVHKSYTGLTVDKNGDNPVYKYGDIWEDKWCVSKSGVRGGKFHTVTMQT